MGAITWVQSRVGEILLGAIPMGEIPFGWNTLGAVPWVESGEGAIPCPPCMESQFGLALDPARILSHQKAEFLDIRSR